MSAIAIRRAGPVDAAALAALAERTFVETFAPDNAAEDMAAYVREAFGEPQQAAEIADPGAVTLLAEAGGRLVGYAQLRRGPAPPSVPHADAIELRRLYVDRPAHGTGIAQRLMAAAFDAARAAGARHVWLGVWERNPRALRFYAKCGFEDVGSHDFVLGADRQTDRILLRPVPGR